jgi:hypothetical protein
VTVWERETDTDVDSVLESDTVCEVVALNVGVP